MRRTLVRLSLLGIGALLGLPPGNATQIEFACVTNNSGQCGAYERQFYGELTPVGNQVLLQLFNDAEGLAASITRIYLDATRGTGPNPLAIIDSVVGSPGTEFAIPSRCGNLPAGNTIGFQADLCAIAMPPTRPNGVDTGQWVRLVLELSSGFTPQQVAARLEGGDFRIGLHVQGLAGGASESLVSREMKPPADHPPVEPVPEPSTWALMSGGLAVLAFRTRKTRKR